LVVFFGFVTFSIAPLYPMLCRARAWIEMSAVHGYFLPIYLCNVKQKVDTFCPLFCSW
jgi:hypothetical protein